MPYTTNPMPALRGPLDDLMETSIAKTWGDLLRTDLLGDIPYEEVAKMLPMPTPPVGLPTTASGQIDFGMATPVAQQTPAKTVTAPAKTANPATAATTPPPKPSEDATYEEWMDWVYQMNDYNMGKLQEGQSQTFEYKIPVGVSNLDEIENAKLWNEQERQKAEQQEAINAQRLQQARQRRGEQAASNLRIETAGGVGYEGTGMGQMFGNFVSQSPLEPLPPPDIYNAKYKAIPGKKMQYETIRLTNKKANKPAQSNNSPTVQTVDPPIYIDNKRYLGRTYVSDIVAAGMESKDIVATAKECIKAGGYYNDLFGAKNYAIGSAPVLSKEWQKVNLGGTINKLNELYGTNQNIFDSGLIELMNVIHELRNTGNVNSNLAKQILDSGLSVLLHASPKKEKSGAGVTYRIADIHNNPNQPPKDRAQIAGVLGSIFKHANGHPITAADDWGNRSDWVYKDDALTSGIGNALIRFWSDYIDKTGMSRALETEEKNRTTGRARFEPAAMRIRMAEILASATLARIFKGDAIF